MGKVADKIIKIKLALEETPGPEDLQTHTTQGEGGIVFSEPYPYGVVCAIHPSTNPCETLINNTISILSAGKCSDSLSSSKSDGSIKVYNEDYQSNYYG